MGPHRQSKRLQPLTPNQEPTSARGKRRANKTPEYLANKNERSKQSYGHRVRGTGSIGRGPFRGPSNRPKGISTENWKKYMSGTSSSL